MNIYLGPKHTRRKRRRALAQSAGARSRPNRSHPPHWQRRKRPPHYAAFRGVGVPRESRLRGI